MVTIHVTLIESDCRHDLSYLLALHAGQCCGRSTCAATSTLRDTALLLTVEETEAQAGAVGPNPTPGSDEATVRPSCAFPRPCYGPPTHRNKAWSLKPTTDVESQAVASLASHLTLSVKRLVYKARITVSSARSYCEHRGRVHLEGSGVGKAREIRERVSERDGRSLPGFVTP